MTRRLQNLEEEIFQFRELFESLRIRPEAEAVEILRRLRATADPLATLRLVREGNPLMPRLVAADQADSHYSKPLQLDQEAFRNSTIRLRARPWTNVAGDGLVSELVSSFFMWDNPFYFSFIDRECFLADMAQERIDGARYCSPLLVSAICAMRCVRKILTVAALGNEG